MFSGYRFTCKHQSYDAAIRPAVWALDSEHRAGDFSGLSEKTSNSTVSCSDLKRKTTLAASVVEDDSSTPSEGTP